jgi:hypothetical protein
MAIHQNRITFPPLLFPQNSNMLAPLYKYRSVVSNRVRVARDLRLGLGEVRRGEELLVT